MTIVEEKCQRKSQWWTRSTVQVSMFTPGKQKQAHFSFLNRNYCKSVWVEEKYSQISSLMFLFLREHVTRTGVTTGCKSVINVKNKRPLSWSGLWCTRNRVHDFYYNIWLHHWRMIRLHFRHHWMKCSNFTFNKKRNPMQTQPRKSLINFPVWYKY